MAFYRKIIVCRLILIALVCNPAVFAQQNEIEWEQFMQNHDLVYNNLSTNWHEGAFTGNGLLGTMLYKKDDNTLRLDVGRTDVYDHGTGDIDNLFSKARLPIGHFTLKPAGNIRTIEARLDLWNAETRGRIRTDKGDIQWRMLTASETELIFFETSSSPGEAAFTWDWQPEKSVSPRAGFREMPAGYTANPEPVISREKEISFCKQELNAGGSYTTAWKEEKGNGKRRFFITIQFDTVASEKSLILAKKQLHRINSKKMEDLVEKHRNWWHRYYPQSFMAIPDARIESFYWIQQYKLASATRRGKPTIDLQGPWTRYTPWPAYWMNLNIQLTYSPLYTANRLYLASSLIDLIDKNTEHLHQNVPTPYRYNSAAIGRTAAPDLISPVSVTRDDTQGLSGMDAEVGNLTWILYYYWQHYRYSMNPETLKKLYPLLKRSINYYIHLSAKNKDGKWEIIPKTYSPEYPGGMGRNTNYDLSLFRWGVNTLLKINRQENYRDTLAPTWQDISDNLIDYPQDETGLLIAQNTPYSQSHRHYSHLLMIYPLYEMNWDQPENRSLIERSFNRWQSMPSALQGYSFTGRASIYAMMGKGNEARDALKILLDKYVKPNTMYLESGPVIETPLAAAASIQELYLQYWNNTVRVFPAVPDDWKNAAFDNFRTEGAFLISALRTEGRTRWVKVRSTSPGKLRIIPGLEGTVKLQSQQANIGLKNEGNGIYSCQMPRNTEITLYTGEGILPEDRIRPVPHSQGTINSFGLK